MRRFSVFALLVAVAACSAPSSEGGGTTDDQDLTATDSADPVLFALDNVKALELTLAPDDVKVLSDQANAVAAQRLSPFAERPRAKGTFTYKGPPVPVTPTCDVTKPYDVTVKIKGMASAQGFDHKPSLRIDFDKAFCGLKNLTLNSMVQDDSLVNEALAYRMYAAIGVPVPRLGYSQVSVNGQPLGVYLTLETIDKNFLKRSFDDATGPLYEGTYGGDLRTSDVGSDKLVYSGSDTAPEATDHKLLRAFIDAVDAPGDAVFFGAAPLVDTNEFLNMMAMAYVIGDWDNYITANNYRLYRSPKTNLWSFIPTGTDQTFRERLHPFRGFVNRDQPFSRLFEKCVGSSRCLAEYEKRLAIAVAKLREPDGTLKGTAARRAALIDAAVKVDRRRPQADAKIKAARLAVDQFIDARAGDIAAASACMQGDAEIYRGACAGLVVRNLADDRCLDSYGSTQTNGALFDSYDCHARRNQRFSVKPAGNGEFELRVLASDKCVDIDGSKVDDGVQLQQWDCHGGANQRFTLRQAEGGTQIVARHSGKCLALAGAVANGVGVVQKTCSADRNQLWKLAGSLLD
jgi:hypothetical protein